LTGLLRSWMVLLFVSPCFSEESMSHCDLATAHFSCYLRTSKLDPASWNLGPEGACVVYRFLLSPNSPVPFSIGAEYGRRLFFPLKLGHLLLPRPPCPARCCNYITVNEDPFLSLCYWILNLSVLVSFDPLFFIKAPLREFPFRSPFGFWSFPAPTCGIFSPKAFIERLVFPPVFRVSAFSPP